MLQNALAAACQAVLQGPLEQHIDLEGADGEHALYTSGGSLVSLFDWRGCRRVPGPAGMSEAAEALRTRLSAWLGSPGHALQVVICRDPEAAGEEVDRAIAPAEIQARELSLSLDDIIASRRRRLREGGVRERTYLAVHTHPAVLATGRSTKAAELSTLPFLRDAQIPVRAAEQVRLIHSALVEAMTSDFAAAGQELQLLSAGEAARVVAWALSPAAGEVGFTPRLPGRRAGGRPCRAVPAAGTRAALTGRDFSSLGIERLSRQLLREHAVVDHTNSTVRIGRTIMQGFDLALAPEELTPFRELLGQVADTEHSVRWRASFLIESGGWHGTTMKRLYASTLTFLSRVHNSRIRDAFLHLQDLDGAVETVVRLRCCFACWDDAGREDRLRESVTRLRYAVERWGNARTDSLAGDPVACVVASVPGAGCAPTAPPAVAPLTDALCMLPLDRPASPWPGGPMTFMEPSGRYFPYRPGSPLQDSWCDIVSGPPGSGKSVLLNAANAAAILSGRGRDEPVPRVSVIDIGSSSAGLVGLIRDALPADRRHLAAAARLQNEREWAINVFDTPIGCRRPTALHRGFLVNFLRLMMEHTSAGGELGGLLGLAVDESYRRRTVDPRPWGSGEVGEVDRALADTGWAADGASTWWECVDHLSEAGLWYEAGLAQRMAVPLLPELSNAAGSPRVADIYGRMKVGTGETALEAFRRVVSEVSAEWPILSNRTVFAMSAARLRVIDLQDVTSRSTEPVARRRSALMYMLARHVCAEGFYIAEDEFPSLDERSGLLPVQRTRLVDRARESQRTPKRLCMDEFHRAGGLDGTIDQVETDVREGRKHNVQVALASQLLTDFPERLASLATGVWICSATAGDIRAATELLDLDESSIGILRHSLTGPSADGAPVFAALNTHGGQVRQLLLHRLGAAELWAFSTTAEDVALRQELSRLVGPERARAILAAQWPSGTARRTIQRLRDAAAEEGSAGEVISGLAAELASGQAGAADG